MNNKCKITFTRDGVRFELAYQTRGRSRFQEVKKVKKKGKWGWDESKAPDTCIHLSHGIYLCMTDKGEFYEWDNLGQDVQRDLTKQEAAEMVCEKIAEGNTELNLKVVAKLE